MAHKDLCILFYMPDTLDISRISCILIVTGDKPMFKELFENELKKRGLNWCKGCNNGRNHRRGFVAWADKKTVHLESEIATRKTLHRGLHEIGHCVNDETGLRTYEREANAEKFATQTMRELGVRVPRDTVRRGVAYVARKKAHGDNIIAAYMKSREKVEKNYIEGK